MAEDYKKQSEELVKRCEAVGWQVVKTGKNYFKVDTRRGIFTISSTPGTAGSVRSTLATANRYGLEELEVKLRERRERERLQRIQDDRQANDAALDRIANGNGDVSTVTSVVKPTSKSLGRIDDGTAIVAVGPALVQTPVMAKPSPLRGGEELLLADERVVYRCVRLGSWRSGDYVDPTQPCNAVFDTVMSLRAHISFHAQDPADITARRAGPGRGLKKLRENEKSMTTATPKKPTADSETTSRFEATRELLLTNVEELAGALFEVGGKLIDVRNQLIDVVAQIKKLEPDAAAPDPELAAKAAKFDALRGTLGDLFQ